MKSRDTGIKLSRQIGGALAGDENRELGTGFVELLYRLGTNSDFESQFQEISVRDRPEVQAISQEVARAAAHWKFAPRFYLTARCCFTVDSLGFRIGRLGPRHCNIPNSVPSLCGSTVLPTAGNKLKIRVFEGNPVGLFPYFLPYY